MDKEKEKKKTLTISSNFKKKIDSNNLSKNEIKKPIQYRMTKKVHSNPQRISKKLIL